MEGCTQWAPDGCRGQVIAKRAALQAAVGKAENGSAEDVKRGKCAELLLEAVR